MDAKCRLLNLVRVFKMHAKPVAAVTFATKFAVMDLSAGCKWSPPVVGGGSKLVCKLLLSPDGRRVKRMSVLLEKCVLGASSKNDI